MMLRLLSSTIHSLSTKRLSQLHALLSALGMGGWWAVSELFYALLAGSGESHFERLLGGRQLPALTRAMLDFHAGWVGDHLPESLLVVGMVVVIGVMLARRGLARRVGTPGAYALLSCVMVAGWGLHLLCFLAAMILPLTPTIAQLTAIDPETAAALAASNRAGTVRTILALLLGLATTWVLWRTEPLSDDR